MNSYRRGRYVVDMYEFQYGGDSDHVLCDFVRDRAQGFGVPAKSLVIENHGGGAGYNYLYVKTSCNGKDWDTTNRLMPDAYENYLLEEAIYYKALIWSSNAKCRFSLIATPGVWTSDELKEIENYVMFNKPVDILSTIEGI